MFFFYCLCDIVSHPMFTSTIVKVLFVVLIQERGLCIYAFTFTQFPSGPGVVFKYSAIFVF